MPEETVVSATPSDSTPTPPAAPAISAPSVSIAPGERPTFAQAFEADAAPVPPESPAPPDAPTTQAAETPAPESAVHPSAEKPPGPIPFPVHQTALANARVKAGEEAVAKYQEQIGGAQTLGLFQKIATNAPGAWRDFTTELLTHPEHGPVVKSELARMFGGLRAPKSAAAPDLAPDVTVQDADGREVARTFSADRVQAIVQHAVQDAIGKAITPLQQDYAQRQEAEKQRAITAQQAETAKQLDASTDAVLADLTELLDLTDDTPQAEKDALLAELGALLDAHPTLSPHKAAMQLRKTRIVPALQGKAQKQVLDDLKTKAAAQGHNPAGAVVAPAHRPTSLLDPSLSWE